MWPLIAMAALSAAKSYSDQKQMDRQRSVEAAKARYSPWTGMKGNSVGNADYAGNLMGGLGAGAMMSQQMNKSDVPNSMPASSATLAGPDSAMQDYSQGSNAQMNPQGLSKWQYAQNMNRMA